MQTQKKMGNSSFFALVLVISLVPANHVLCAPAPSCEPVEATDEDRLQFTLNFELLVAEFFVYGAFGVGLDVVAPGYAMVGPPPIGTQKANLDPPTQRIIENLLVARLLATEYGQDAAIRTLLYKIADFIVPPYGITVAEFTDKISNLRNQLAMCGNKDEGIIVPKQLGAENRTESNILSADANSISYDRTPREILRISYGTGNASMPGGFLPQGGNGVIAKSFLENA
ncbi:hypothetical protein Tsubulata_037101 [Turnera subulata]|uniref:Desiccation-related protein PCC13-62 n=1 Tax=Turnera subulata TaxID=218843 RepID=A0A9Q0G449_9ROSI|nr:hypothetical protein Tsubulata_037101 [Turnera subulata]